MGGAMLVNIVLSMALAFSQSPLYPYYAHIVNRPGNISAMTDQQIAAGIMWSAGDLPFALVVAWLAYAWMAQIERDTDETGRAPRRSRHERPRPPYRHHAPRGRRCRGGSAGGAGSPGGSRSRSGSQ